MTRSRNSRTPKKRPTGRSRAWLGWALKLSLVGLVIIAGFAVYLDAVVQEKFSGKRWTIPAKVYARPLELFTGQKLSKNDFLTELDALGYRRESAANGPGAAAVNGNTVDLNTRGFQFYEGMEPAQFVRVRFSGDYVAGLAGADGKALDVVRLEPLMIGGIYPKNLEDRILIKIDQVPKYLLETLVATEDRDFYSHLGVSPKSIARAMWVNTSSGSMRQGGSTLTQQLVKNFYLTSERSLSRKLTEAMMAVLLELHYDKREILEAYLNEVFVGQDGQRAVHGFGLAPASSSSASRCPSSSCIKLRCWSAWSRARPTTTRAVTRNVRWPGVTWYWTWSPSRVWPARPKWMRRRRCRWASPSAAVWPTVRSRPSSTWSSASCVRTTATKT